jgi:hypothetical protein
MDGEPASKVRLEAVEEGGIDRDMRQVKLTGRLSAMLNVLLGHVKFAELSPAYSNGAATAGRSK